MMTPTLPLYAKTLGTPDSLIGWVIASTTLVAIIFRPLVGAALDRLGRKWLLLSGIFFMGLLTLAISFFPIFAVLIMLRTVMGAAWAVTNTSSSTVAADIIPRKRFGEGIGFYGFSASFAMAFAPALSLYIFSIQGVELALTIGFCSFMASLLLALTLRYRPGSKQPVHPSAPKGIATFIETKALLPAAMAFFLMGSFGAVQAFAAILADARNITGAPLFFFAFAGLMLIARPVFGKLIDQRGYRLPLLIGLIAVFIGLIVLSLAQSLVILLLAGVALGIGFGAASPTIQTMAVADAPPSRRGTATATYFVGFDGGLGLGALSGGLLAQTLGYGAMFQLLALLPLITLLIYLLTANRNTTTPSR